MKTAVIGFPRIGALRELKFSSEKYFRNEITEPCEKHTGKYKKRQELILFPAMIFPIMMVSWMPLLCAELSQSVIRS